jgi:DNA-binding protein WhiA
MTFIQKIKKEILKRKTESELQQYVSDVFLTSANGSIKNGYQIDFAFDDLNNAQGFCDILAAYDILPKLTQRNGQVTVYIKSHEDICNLLALVGASKSLMELSNEIALREVRGNANRRANCDSGNIAKQVATAAEQVTLIKKLDLDSLDIKLRQAAQARLEYPQASYEELAEKLGVSKSGLVHRLRKLMA